jgi:hypothetical protein
MAVPCIELMRPVCLTDCRPTSLRELLQIGEHMFPLAPATGAPIIQFGIVPAPLQSETAVNFDFRRSDAVKVRLCLTLLHVLSTFRISAFTSNDFSEHVINMRSLSNPVRAACLLALRHRSP